MPTIGWLSLDPPCDPWNSALPNEKMPPSDEPSQYPRLGLDGFWLHCGCGVHVTGVLLWYQMVTLPF